MKTSILTTLALRSVLRPTFVLGGLALLAIPTLGMLMSTPCHLPPASGTVALELDAPSDPDCYYATAFDAPVVLDRATIVEGRAVHLTQRYQWRDGCTWEAQETLDPHGSLYAYSYEEKVISCEIGATPARACERHGVVTMRSVP